MNWEQKLAALNALAETYPKMRKPGNWCVWSTIEIGGDGCLSGRYGNGHSPEEAVNDHWRQLVDELPPTHYLVVDAYKPTRKQFHWNGYMWAEIPVERREQA